MRSVKDIENTGPIIQAEVRLLGAEASPPMLYISRYWCCIHTWTCCHWKRQGSDSRLNFPTWLVKNPSEKHQTSMEKNLRWKQIISKGTLILQRTHNCSTKKWWDGSRKTRQKRRNKGWSSWTHKQKIRHVLPVIEDLPTSIPSPDFLGDHLDYMKWQVEQDREAENSDHPVPRSQVDPKCVPDDANFNVFLQSREEEHQEIARQRWEEKQVNGTDNPSPNRRGVFAVWKFKPAFQSKIQHLKLNPQILPELRQDYLRPLEKKKTA